MATTDLHGHVLPFDYYTDRPVDTVGLARIAALVARARAGAANSVLVDNGDFLHGNPLADFVARRRKPAAGGVHPVIAAMNALGFDAATLGNHEFNYGLDFLLGALAAAEFPVVTANVATRARGAGPRGDATLVRPYVILERTVIDGAGLRHPLRLGLIGFVPPQIMTWDRHHLEGRVTARDIVATARAWVPEMKEAGADIVVALSHSGIGAAAASEGMENASVPLARVTGIDALVTGHSHLLFPGPAFAGRAGVDAGAGTIHGKPAVMSGFWGSHLGVIDLVIERSGNAWRVVDQKTGLRPIARRGPGRSVVALVESDAAVLAPAAADHRRTRAYLRRPVGRTTVPLHSYFARVAPASALRLVALAQRWQVARMLAATAHAHLPILSAAAPFKAGGRAGPEHYTDIPPGDIAIRHVADLYPHPNTLRALRVSGAELKEWLERSAGAFNRIRPGLPGQRLLTPDFPSHDFDVIDGVEYRIDLSRPSKYDPRSGAPADPGPGPGRIVGLRFEGRPVRADDRFIVATNSYRAGGGGNFRGIGAAVAVLEPADTNREVLRRYIAHCGAIGPLAARNWSFVAMPGTGVLFDTGPGAAAYPDEAAELGIEPAGAGAGGFARFRLAL